MGKAEETKQAIIEQAASLFNLKGYAATSIPEITKAIDITKGSFYGNFKNKEEIELAAFEYNVGIINSALRKEIKARDNAIDKLLVFEEYYYNGMKNHRLPAGCAILNTAIEADDTHPKLNEKVVAALDNWKHSMISIIEKGKKYGQIREDVKAEDYAILFIGMIEGAVMLSKVYKSIKPIHTIMKRYSKIVTEELKK